MKLYFRIHKLGHKGKRTIQREVYGLCASYARLLPGEWYRVRSVDGCGASWATNDGQAFAELYKRVRASTIQACLQVAINGEWVREVWA